MVKIIIKEERVDQEMLIEAIDKVFHKNDLVIIQTKEMIFWPAKIIRKLVKSYYKVELLNKKLIEKYHIRDIVLFDEQQKERILQQYEQRQMKNQDLLKAIQLCEKEYRYKIQMDQRNGNHIKKARRNQRIAPKKIIRNAGKGKRQIKGLQDFYRGNLENQYEVIEDSSTNKNKLDASDNLTCTLFQDDLQQIQSFQLFFSDEIKNIQTQENLYAQQQGKIWKENFKDQNKGILISLQKMIKILAEDSHTDIFLQSQREQFYSALKIYRKMAFSAPILKKMVQFCKSFEEKFKQSRKFCLKEYLKIKQIFQTATLLQNKCNFSPQILDIMTQYNDKNVLKI